MDRNASAAGFADFSSDPRSAAYSRLLRKLRAAIAKEVSRENLSLRALAKRLEVSPSVVSRVLSGENDVLTSTLFDFAWALDREWEFTLVAVEGQEDQTQGRNFFQGDKDHGPEWVSAGSQTRSPLDTDDQPIGWKIRKLAPHPQADGS